MMKKIIISIVALLAIGGIITASVILSRPNSYDNGSIVASSSNNATTDTDSGIDWSSSDTYDVTLANEDIYITKAGVYNITGTLNGKIVVNTDGDVKLVLNNATITNESGPAIYVENANNVYIELVGENSITSKTNSDLDAAIYSKDDLIIYGSGSITINSNYDGIASKDDLEILSGTYNITASADAIKGKDSVYIKNGTFNLTSGEDGIKTTNEEEKGELTIDGGTFKIKASDKGIKSESLLTINGGEFDITASSDGLHSNGDIVINNGNFTISVKDDGIHADGRVEINNGTFNITAGEGIEATYVKINDGTINISATDDGINAGNKSDKYSVTIEINGGKITIKMGSGDTDGIDSNGDLYINGGTIDITGQSPFDYDGTAKYNGGTIIVNGEETNQITNQFMGGGMQGGMQGAMNQGQTPNQDQNRGMMGGRR